MTFAERLTRWDGWLIDQLFQPLADRLPFERAAIQLGMSFQLGSLMLTAMALLMPIVLLGASFGDTVDSCLILLMNFAFFMGMKRSAPLVRAGMMNPLRPMLMAQRLISIAFVLYQAWWCLGAHGIMFDVSFVMLLSQITFVLGLYFVACQPRPPRARFAQKNGQIIDGPWSTSGQLR
ncbi:hypothetical protein AA106555_1073 [Neokomagataea thailandica NBRC 106555]|uniref:Uncharacterized protein n=2 Tax=Neokomagataea TaxID=1223423 RepID=A0A4Y6V7D6_9PROT|nr:MULTISPECIES: hypothetical protein [Neokomagataea]QDH24235.1 hypothetical protein D5366_01990 [Neokomagataea tanensis]GBR52881.1 hypothetical protein AA106555_1073 [Neokomagataea thailandica NBRC 106555]